MGAFNLHSVKNLRALWVTTCLAAYGLFFKSFYSFSKEHRISYETTDDMLLFVNMFGVLSLFAVGDFGLISINRHLTLKISSKGNKVIRFLKDLIFILLHGGIMLYCCNTYFNDLRTFQYAITILTVVNCLWLSIKLRHLVKEIIWIKSIDEDMVLSKLVLEVQLTVIYWIILNISFLFVSIFIIFHENIVGEFVDINLAWLALLLIRIVSDFIICHKYYGKVLLGKYNFPDSD